eukprot:CAMPEP_0181425330 /NCGR_PEP_ID=MMETSP1110-20121109/15101_1 /TAXON_ID=174948 /ORGANISM="Symbiodinium sp., Strain CCMP421" /LENGTH=85 /DNA_ID=CAMNT_0023548509 /DNA_START=7694 /DNA_END=7952 /DNA_ORIENTATION=-
MNEDECNGERDPALGFLGHINKDMMVDSSLRTSTLFTREPEGPTKREEWQPLAFQHALSQPRDAKERNDLKGKDNVDECSAWTGL